MIESIFYRYLSKINRDTLRTGKYTIGNLRLDIKARRLFRGAERLPLADLRWQLLVYLVENHPAEMSVKEVCRHIYSNAGKDYVQRLRNLAHYLREGLGDEGELVKWDGGRLWIEEVNPVPSDRPEVPPEPRAEGVTALVPVRKQNSIPIVLSRPKRPLTRAWGRMALLVLGASVVLAIAYKGFSFYWPKSGYKRPVLEQPRPLIILVAKFERDGQPARRVTKTLYNKLKLAMAPESGVEVRYLPKHIPWTDDESARREARKEQATLIVWGDYDATTTSAIITSHIQFVETTRAEGPDLPYEHLGTFAELENYSIQMTVATHVEYVASTLLGLVHFAHRDFDGAIRLFRRAVALPVGDQENPDLATANFYLGTSCLHANKLDCAMEYLNEALRLRPTSSAFINRADAFLSLEQPERARPDCQGALDVAVGKQQQARAHLCLGNSLKRSELLGLAAKQLRQAINLDLDLLPAYDLLASVYARSGSPRLAAATYREAFSVISAPAPLLIFAGENERLLGNYTMALSDFNKAIGILPQMHRALYYRGMAYADQGRFDDAIADLTAFLASYHGGQQEQIQLFNEQDSYWIHNSTEFIMGAHLVIARALLGKGRVEAAQQSINEFRLNPQFIGWIDHCGATPGLRVEQSIVECDTAITLMPERAAPRAYRASWFATFGDPFRAESDINQALSLEPDCIEALITRCRIFLMRGGQDDAASAERNAARAIELGPQVAQTHHWMGLVRFQQGRYAEAIHEANLAINLSPLQPDFLKSRADSSCRLNRFDTALGDYSAAIDLNSSRGVYYNNRADCYLRHGELQLALADASEALRLEPDEYVYYETRGSVFQSMHLRDKALDDFDSSLGKRPDYDVALLKKGKLLLEMGDKQKAHEVLERALRVSKQESTKHAVQLELQRARE